MMIKNKNNNINISKKHFLNDDWFTIFFFFFSFTPWILNCIISISCNTIFIGKNDPNFL